VTPLDWPTPKTPYCVPTSGPYLLHNLSYRRFCIVNRKFSLPWQRVSLRAKFEWHNFIGRPRKPYHRAKNYDSILYTNEVMVNLLLKFPNFCYHSSRGRLSKVWVTPLNWPTMTVLTCTVRHYCVQTSGPYLLHKLSYRQFCVENRKLSLFVSMATRVCQSQMWLA